MSDVIDVSTFDPTLILGKAAILRHAYEGRDLSELLDRFLEAFARDPANAAALLDLSFVLGAAGQRDKALEIQARALSLRRCYRLSRGVGNGLKLAAFVVPGDFMANTPLEFLVEGADIDLWLIYVDADLCALTDIPEHDVGFMAVGESPDNAGVLRHLPQLLKDWPRPIVNNSAETISALTRDGVCQLFVDEPRILAPATVRVDRADLMQIVERKRSLDTPPIEMAFPIIVRPVGTHAGQGMEKVASTEDLAGYLAQHQDLVFYIAPFIDYSGPDGLFRKQRIAFIDGRAYPSHWATSDHWMVHYLSAQMADRPERRAEEEAWMAHFDEDFAVRHASAFQVLNRRFGLDYFGIDCAELPDGRLLLFEADVAMIVHDLDPGETFPYKKPAMRRLFDAFEAMLRARAARTPRGSTE
jgi:hypothetical protein